MDKDLEMKIRGLSDTDFTLPSEVEVVMDDLASTLISKFDLDSDDYWGWTPSLFEVIEDLVRKKRLPTQANDVATDANDLLREAYGDELGEDESEALESEVEKLQHMLLDHLCHE